MNPIDHRARRVMVAHRAQHMGPQVESTIRGLHDIDGEHARRLAACVSVQGTVADMLAAGNHDGRELAAAVTACAAHWQAWAAALLDEEAER